MVDLDAGPSNRLHPQAGLARPVTRTPLLSDGLEVSVSTMSSLMEPIRHSWGAALVFVLLLLLVIAALAAVAAWQLLAPPARKAPVCAIDTDCSLNGDCINGTCFCDPGWTGEVCGQLDLEPANLSEAYMPPDGGSSWCISVVHDNSSGSSLFHWHGFVSEFRHSCGLNSWACNSYVNHIVAERPEGPWHQAAEGEALSTWAHNPKVVFSPVDKTWLLFHIGTEKASCGGCSCSPCLADVPSTPGRLSPAGSSPTAAPPPSASPIQFHFAPSLDGPWKQGSTLGLKLANQDSRPLSFFRNVTNCPVPADETCVTSATGPSQEAPSGGVWLHQRHGSGKAFIPFAAFSADHPGGPLIWRACTSARKFDNGNFLYRGDAGSLVSSIEVKSDAGAVAVLVHPSVCNISTSADIFSGALAIGSADGAVEVEGALFLQLVPGCRCAGRVPRAEDCRAGCAESETCTAYSWLGPGDQRCMTREDSFWMPSEQEGAVSGRPWGFSLDNPAPWVDPETGELRIMYRTGTKGYLGTEANSAYFGYSSEIGQYRASYWAATYEPVSAFGGPISSPQYPLDENEDPFLWRNKRGWHALFHANTWLNSHGRQFQASEWAGRYAWSLDGVSWTYSPEPAYNSSIRLVNGSVVVFDRMERPFLLLDARGFPTHLYNAVCPSCDSSDDRSYTLMHRIRRHHAS